MTLAIVKDSIPSMFKEFVIIKVRLFVNFLALSRSCIFTKNPRLIELDIVGLKDFFPALREKVTEIVFLNALTFLETKQADFFQRLSLDNTDECS